VSAVDDEDELEDDRGDEDDGEGDEEPLGAETVAAVRDPATGRVLLVGCAKRTYALADDGRLTLADEQASLVGVPELGLDEDDAYAVLLDDTDVCAPKVATDVVVMDATAFSRERTRELYVAVAAGASARRLRVVGERVAEVRPDGAVRFSSPEAFTEAKIGWDAAYGGYDDHAHRTLAPPTATERLARCMPLGLFAYPRNSFGRAYFVDVDRRRADGARLPLVEEPGDPLVPERFFVPRPAAWLDAPLAAGLGWQHHAWFPRAVRSVSPFLAFDPPERPVREIALGEGDDLPDTARLERGALHPRALQGAAAGLSRERLRGDELVILSSLHPRVADLRFALPGETPRITLRPPAVKAFTPPPVLQTVRVDPAAGRVTLTWCAAVPLLARVDEDFLAECDLAVEWR
jgi:hypothetical protein